MIDPMTKRPPVSSRARYRDFVEDYKQKRLDDKTEADAKSTSPPADSAEGDVASPAAKRSKRRKYARDYLRWLRPHRAEVGLVFFLALLTGALQMVEPLFMRFIIDRVLLN